MPTRYRRFVPRPPPPQGVVYVPTLLSDQSGGCSGARPTNLSAPPKSLSEVERVYKEIMRHMAKAAGDIHVALALSLYENDVEVSQKLVDLGANIDHQNGHGYT